MDEFGGKKVQHFLEDVFQEREHGLITGAEDILLDPPVRPDGIRSAGTAKFGVTGQGGQCVSGQSWQGSQ